MRRTVWFAFATALIALPASLAFEPQADDSQPSASVSTDLPRTGTAAPELESIDRAAEEIPEQHGTPGASITIAYNGKVLLSRGYGFANLDAGEPMRPETRFLLASVSKAITAVTMLVLVERGTFGLDDAAYPLVEPIEPPPGMAANQQVLGITVRQLLHHEGGWNRQTSGDPATWGRRVMRALHLSTLPTMFDLARYMLAQPLDFAPGTEAVYSNFGYDLCGVIVTRQSSRFYAATAEELGFGKWGSTA
ncbi:MAG: serine hydrolase domain-containing protein [Phycisphaerae bacterium]|nr:serine hydrolase domain-containing protein [Phycisphaerae bacterium]